MTIRNDIWVDFSSSPRIVWVTAPSTTVTIQDLVDSLRYIEADQFSISYPQLIKAAGKDVLGGGVIVGLTATLLNAQIAFEARSGPDFIQCSIDGGNLVALDSSDNPISPIFPTAYTQVVKTSSSSATISGLEIANLQRLIESLRPNHKGYGNIWYWDPSNGSDANSGDHPLRGVKTFARAHALAIDWNHDIITIVPSKNSPTIIHEPLHITKNYLFVRGAGYNTHIHPMTTTPSGCLVDVSGDGVELSGFHIEGFNITTPNTDGILFSGGHFLMNNVIVEDCTGNGIVVTSTVADDRSEINNTIVRANGKAGMRYNSGNYLEIKDSSFEDNVEHGVDLTGAGSTDDVLFHHTNFRSNGGYGININNSNVTGTVIESECLFSGNVLGDYLDNGVATIIQSRKEESDLSHAVWSTQTSQYTIAGTMGYAQNQTSGLSSNQATMLLEMYELLGLDPTKPLIVTDTTRSAGSGIQQTIVSNQTQTTVTRL